MNEDYRKFFKDPVRNYKIGGYVPASVHLLDDSPKVDLSWISRTKYGSALFFISSSCSACDINVPLECSIKYDQLEFAVFCENYDDLINELSMKYPKVKFYRTNSSYIEAGFGIRAVPFLLVVNCIGQIIQAGIASRESSVTGLLQPLLNVITY
jgi:hypothetical protein